MSDRFSQARFANGFFEFLTENGYRYAVLHGWEDGFESEISDIDFVVERAVIDDLVQLARDYCSRTGWKLVQVLWHETTAAYMICVNPNLLGQAVALDACSDYQRNGHVFFSPEEMLHDTEQTSDGIYRVSDVNHLLYRVVKAAAKLKPVSDLVQECASFSREVRDHASKQLWTRWKTDPGNWSGTELETTLAQILAESRSWRHSFGVSSLIRIIRRVVRPDGLLLEVTGLNDFELELLEALSPLFRHSKWSRGNLVADLGCVMRSGLVLTASRGRYFFLPKSLKISVERGADLNGAFSQVIQFLEARNLLREGC